MTDKVDLGTVRDHIAILRWCKQRAKEIKELETKARDEIEAAMGDAEEGVVDGETVVAWKRHKQNRFNHSALKEAAPEIVAAYSDTVEVRRFTLVEKDEE